MSVSSLTAHLFIDKFVHLSSHSLVKVPLSVGLHSNGHTTRSANRDGCGVGLEEGLLGHVLK